MSLGQSFNGKRNSITLAEWISENPSVEDLRIVFLNMDRALKYIHEHGYCIEVFYPTEIEILNNELDHIQFNRLLELSKDPLRKKVMEKEDIFKSSLIQVGIYSGTLSQINPNFMKENFDKYVYSLPSVDVPYYRGVIERGAHVYFCEFVTERSKRDLADLENQLSEGEGKGKQLLKSNGQNIGIESITNDKINDTIYSQINGLRDAAFINYLIYPTLILIILVVLGVIAWVFSLI